MDRNKIYDVLIDGGGVVGCANAYALTFTNIKNALLIEKNSNIALVNSNTESNAQTLHGGDTETNFVFEKAMKMREAERLIAHFLEKFGHGAFRHVYKMALGTTEAEVEILENRFEMLKAYYPLKFLSREEIGKIEPVLIEGRDPSKPIRALYRENGYAVDYHKLALAFRREAEKSDKVEFVFDTKIKEILRNGNLFEVQTNNGTYFAIAIIVSAGPYSLKHAQDFDAKDEDGEEAKDHGILPVGGSFYKAKRLISGKIYPVQDPKFPFARVHADPAINNSLEMRLGPTAKVLPMFERHHWATIWDFMRSGILSGRGVRSVFGLFRDLDMTRFTWKNFIYDLPWIGKKEFLKEARNIIPTLGVKDLTFAKGAGGIRPQLINMKTGKLEMGVGKFFADKAIFNITPSPGASDSLRNGVIDAKSIVDFLGSGYKFDEAKFNETLFGSAEGGERSAI